jgi:hypothetical protein
MNQKKKKGKETEKADNLQFQQYNCIVFGYVLFFCVTDLILKIYECIHSVTIV